MVVLLLPCLASQNMDRHGKQSFVQESLSTCLNNAARSALFFRKVQLTPAAAAAAGKAAKGRAGSKGGTKGGPLGRMLHNHWKKQLKRQTGRRSWLLCKQRRQQQQQQQQQQPTGSKRSSDADISSSTSTASSSGRAAVAVKGPWSSRGSRGRSLQPRRRSSRLTV
jgi:hypothetical protein